MNGKRGNSLVVIINGKPSVYCLDDRLIWKIGRRSSETRPDIELDLPTVSRKHGVIKNIDGFWFYYDVNGKNGTVYNGEKISPGICGRIKPVMLNGGDILIFGGGEHAAVNSKTIWSMFYETTLDKPWRVEDTNGIKDPVFTDGIKTVNTQNPAKGSVIDLENGMAIYMGEVTYLTGDIKVTGA